MCLILNTCDNIQLIKFFQIIIDVNDMLVS
jgi:hypothetical protein